MTRHPPIVPERGVPLTAETVVVPVGDGHASDCAVHNAPALPVGPCDCGSPFLEPDEIQRAKELRRDPDSEDNERFASWYGDTLLEVHQLAIQMDATLSAAPAREPEGGAVWFGVTGAADETEALAVALFDARCPGIRMTDEDLHYYRAAAQRAMQAVTNELDTPALTPKEAPAATGAEEPVLMLSGSPFGTGLSEPRLVRAQPQAREEARAVCWIMRHMFGNDTWSDWMVVREKVAKAHMRDTAYRIGRKQVMAVSPPSRPLAEGADADKLRIAVEDIAAERQRQVEKEKRSTASDDLHIEGELARGAVAYALAGSGFSHDAAREMWPARWHYSWWKPTTPRRDLVKAGALIVAEIERLDRLSTPEEGTKL